MTLEEAIKHAEEVAEEQDRLCKRYDDASGYTRSHNEDIRTTDAKKCVECAKEHRQLAEWLKELKQLREQTRWIPVSERLPEIHKEVIVTDIETSDAYQSRYIGDGHWECDNGLFKNRIIAWMPLPEPYKAESEKV